MWWQTHREIWTSSSPEDLIAAMKSSSSLLCQLWCWEGTQPNGLKQEPGVICWPLCGTATHGSPSKPPRVWITLTFLFPSLWTEATQEGCCVFRGLCGEGAGFLLQLPILYFHPCTNMVHSTNIRFAYMVITAEHFCYQQQAFREERVRSTKKNCECMQRTSLNSRKHNCLSWSGECLRSWLIKCWPID